MFLRRLINRLLQFSLRTLFQFGFATALTQNTGLINANINSNNNKLNNLLLVKHKWFFAIDLSLLAVI